MIAAEKTCVAGKRDRFGDWRQEGSEAETPTMHAFTITRAPGRLAKVVAFRV
jgi:hypothetical protein